MSRSFDADTEVRAQGQDEFAATITDRWNALGGGPNGGYLLAVCGQALRQVMPFPDPLVVSAFFLRSAVPGAARVRTEIARVGRRVATGEARLVQEDREVVRAVATFGDLAAATGRTLVLNTGPDLPAPEDSVDLLDGGSMPGVSITERVEYRGPRIPGWRRGRPSGDPSMEFWMRFSDGRAPDLISLLLLVDAAAPAVLEIGERVSATMQLTVHLRAHPAPASGWLACRVATRHVMGGYHEEDFEIWDADGTLVAQARQFALLPTSQR